MRIVGKYRANACWPAVLLLLLLWVSGCSGIAPYQPRNHREEGPERGVFTGSKGEVVILVPGESHLQDEAAKKASKEPPRSE
jgi:hypothetical protein